MGFPKNFDFGVASSAYQVEGAWNENGKGASIWDTYAAVPGNIADGTTGEVGCDHYHHYLEDIALMKEMGVDSYRFSVSWSRIYPQGIGVLNQEGLAFYDRVVDALLEAGISPILNLHHYDLPQAMLDAGGWPERKVAEASVIYAETIFRHFKGRVKRYVCMNDARSTLLGGYLMGNRAPGYAGRFKEAVQGWHHINVACAVARKALAEIDPEAQMGFVLGVVPFLPAEENDASRQAAKQMNFLYNDCFLAPMLKGMYPEEVKPFLTRMQALPNVLPGDLELLRQFPQDFMGVNYYTVMRVKPNPSGNPSNPMSMVHIERREPVTDSGWEIYPEGLYQVLTELRDHYQNPPVFVSEVGGAFRDDHMDGETVIDDDRIDLLSRSFAQAERALADGCNLTGLHVWSLLDNFEWQCGFSKKFGLIRIDHQDQTRHPKKSAKWYRDFIAASRD